MRLLIDCGNTRIKWGLRVDDRWVASGALPLAETDQLADRIARPDSGIEAWGCIVAGEETARRIEGALARPVRWITPARSACGVSNGYESPERLGPDRWAALIGARSLQPRGACLVVNAGTATTVDVLDAAGMFQGGLILPGVDLMQDALARNTARLPAGRGQYRAVPTNTRDAITSGALHATVGAIERMFSPLAPDAQSVCLLSGGAALQLAPLLGVPTRLVERLVLEGLARIAAEDI